MVNNYMLKTIFLLTFSFFSFNASAQLTLQADSVINLFDTIGDKNERVIAICKSAQRGIGSNIELSVQIAEKALEIAKKNEALEGLKMCYITLGGISYFKADYDKAIEYFYGAIDVADKNGELSVKDAGIIGNIGVIFKKQGNLPKALSQQSKALTVFESKNDSMGISITHTNIGEIYRIQKKYDKALTSYKKSAAIKLSLGHQSGLGIVYNNMGLCYSEQGNFEKAGLYLSKAYLIEKEIGNQVRITETQLDLANHYYLSKQYLKSVKNAETSLVSSKELGLKSNISDLYLVLSQNHEALNNYKKAHNYHKLYSDQRAKILNEDINEKIAEMDVKYETAQREKELERKNFELKTQEAEIEKNKLQRNAFAIVLLLALIIAYFLFQANRQNKQLAILMTGQNLLIETKNTALETININTNNELEKLQIDIEDKEKILTNIFAIKQQVELPPELRALSKREIEVLSYLTLGWSDQEISDKLFVSKATIKTHLRRIYSKLLVKSRTEAVNIAHKHELIGSI
jgi:ATP/maltotriose-dependent transcriptional regulator MalT